MSKLVKRPVHKVTPAQRKAAKSTAAKLIRPKDKKRPSILKQPKRGQGLKQNY